MPRGRPRIHPLPDPSAPPRPRGRPRKISPPPAYISNVLPPALSSTPPEPAPHILINSQPITWAFIRLVHKRLGNDWDITIDAFWKARRATGYNGIYRYIMAGLRSAETPAPGSVPTNSKSAYSTKPWIYHPSSDREAGRMENIREWWLSLYTPSTAKATASAEVQSMVDAIAAKFGGVL